MTAPLPTGDTTITPPTPGTPPNPLNTNSDLMTALQQQILGQSGMVSSYNSTLQSNITNLQQAGADTDKATNMQYDRQIADVTGQSLNDSINGRAGGDGGVMNLAALNQLTQNTDKQISTLNDQRQQALLNNDAASAKSISDMTLNALQFQQKANQDVFANLLNLGQFGVQQQTEQRAQAAANDAHTKALVEMIQDNPQAGITMDDSIEGAAAKIGKNPNSPDVQLKKAQIAKAYYDMAHPSTGTESERADTLISQYQSKFVPGATMKDGTPTVDQNGFITPKAFKSALADVPASVQDSFIKKFAPQLFVDKDSTDYSAYGLTAKQVKDNITG